MRSLFSACCRRRLGGRQQLPVWLINGLVLLSHGHHAWAAVDDGNRVIAMGYPTGGEIHAEDIHGRRVQTDEEEEHCEDFDEDHCEEHGCEWHDDHGDCHNAGEWPCTGVADAVLAMS
jgi:hypothetical protein